MQAALQAVSTPQRRRILQLVWDKELTSRDIAEHFDTTWQAVSHNLRVLREANLVYERRDGVRRLYRAARDELAPLEALLKDFWKTDLQQLDRVIKQDRRKKKR